ncbi:cytochrome b/b6 domain-containing protein [Hymenobacter sp. DG01]|uniref:cytochrome b/b6 domain-containing protein n=1 Tax=Hymenobacter sp. DG01 TaxID=2584940 RepID=UPI001122EF3C|nr:cytochrome b/b6 domain-containing protein [Hymenobacter sp. DG01]
MTPQTEQAPPTTGLKRNSLGLRIWHWTNSALVSAQLLTILFLSVIVKTKTLAPEFSKALAEKGVQMSPTDLRGLSRIVSHRIWDWHIWLGLALAVVLAYRVLVSFRQRGGQRTAAKLARLKARTAQGDPTVGLGVWVRYSYRAFYLVLAVMVVTGLILVFEDYFRSIEHTAKEIHNASMYLVIAFVVAHILGVFRAEVTHEPGITSDMIHGGRPVENA